ncbi:MAG: BON domain-containing protein [Gammaproteobacteria bacterium]|nr:BON domain-containing protein [Gammaproteobacteria bacterium]
MNEEIIRKRLSPRNTWLISASVLAASMALSPVYADYDKDDGDKSESRAAGEVVTDTWITTRAKSVLLADREVSGFDISVETRDQVVYLSGEVENQSQVSHAVELVEEIDGVESVDATSLRIATAVDQVRDAVSSSE